uniref:Putative secreted protein n=1 Tax=Anopheles triannulatus TaxID=58253 RepID=A0A2M4B402_9DIPT
MARNLSNAAPRKCLVNILLSFLLRLLWASGQRQRLEPVLHLQYDRSWVRAGRQLPLCEILARWLDDMVTREAKQNP